MIFDDWGTASSTSHTNPRSLSLSLRLQPVCARPLVRSVDVQTSASEKAPCRSLCFWSGLELEIILHSYFFRKPAGMTSRSSSEPMPLEQKTISRFSISKSKVTRVQAAEEVEFVTELSTANDAQSHGHVQRLAQSPEKKFHGMRKYGVAHDLSTFGTHFNGLTTKRSDSSDYASGSCSEFDSWGKTPGNRELAALKGFRSYPDLTNRQEFGECVKKILVDEVDIKMHRKKLSGKAKKQKKRSRQFQSQSQMNPIHWKRSTARFGSPNSPTVIFFSILALSTWCTRSTISSVSHSSQTHKQNFQSELKCSSCRSFYMHFSYSFLLFHLSPLPFDRHLPSHYKREMLRKRELCSLSLSLAADLFCECTWCCWPRCTCGCLTPAIRL